MNRRMRVLGLTTALVSSSAMVVAPTALAAEHCVGKHAGCSATLEDALDAAGDGDTIRLEAGTFAGGATVTKSVAIVGAGRGATILKGGGPVLTIGTLFDDTPPAVSIRDMTITGGHTTSSPLSAEFVGEEGVIALGGGIEIPPGHDFTPGAEVTITRTSITGNRVAPVATLPLGPPCPGGVNCPFALGSGGGIDNWGTLTITDSTISDNRVGSASGISTLASDAAAGGVSSQIGTLTIVSSRIEDNRATATAPNGRFAENAGVSVGASLFGFDTGPFRMSDSRVTGNSAQLDAALPSSVELSAIVGGIHVGEKVPRAEIARSVIAGNSVGMTNTTGDVLTFSGGLHVDLPVDFEIRDSTIADNRVSAATLGSSPGLAHADSGGALLFGRMVGTRVFDNVVAATSAGGDAEAMAGGSWVLYGDVSGSELRGNRLLATAPNGEARARGGGAIVDSTPELPDQGGLSLTDSSVADNTGVARGASSVAQGGGIFDGTLPGGPFGGTLVLAGSSITDNALKGRPGAVLEGGGVFLDGALLTQTNSVIAGNRPDQCFGCDPTLSAAPRGKEDAARMSQRYRHDTAGHHANMPLVHPR